MLRRSFTLSLVLVLASSLAAPAAQAAPTGECHTVYVGGTPTFTETVAYPSGSFNAQMNTVTPKVAPGGLFTFDYRSQIKPTRLYATRTITYTTSRGLTSTIKRNTSSRSFDPLRGIVLPDLRLAGTFTSQDVFFYTDPKHRYDLTCYYYSPTAKY